MIGSTRDERTEATVVWGAGPLTVRQSRGDHPWALLAVLFGEFSFITVRCYTRALRRDPQGAKGMTTEVYPRENCIAPDMCCIVYEPGSPRTQEVEGGEDRDGRS